MFDINKSKATQLEMSHLIEKNENIRNKFNKINDEIKILENEKV